MAIKKSVKKSVKAKKPKTKTYLVDVHWDVAKVFKVEATSAEEAEKKMEEIINKGGVSVWTDGFQATDDVEWKTSGEIGKDGVEEYY